MPDRVKILRAVMDAVRFVQDASGRPIDALSEGTDLLAEVEGFDSLNALEVLVQVSLDLRLNVPDDILRPLTNDRKLTVGAMVDRIVAFSKEPSNVKQPA